MRKYSNNLNNLLTILISLIGVGLLFSGQAAIAECAPFKHSPHELQSIQMAQGPYASDDDLALGYIEKAETLPSSPENACEKARLFNVIVQGQWPQTSEHLLQKALIGQVEALFQAGDWRGTISSANLFIDDFHDSDEEQRIHYLLLKAQSRLVETSGFNLGEAKRALGLQPLQSTHKLLVKSSRRSYGTVHIPILDEQCRPIRTANSEFDVHIYRRSYNSFLIKYPASPYTDEINTLKQAAQHRLAIGNIEAALYYFDMGQYRAVIERMKRVLELGSSNLNEPQLIQQHSDDVLNKAMYLMGASFHRLSKMASGDAHISILDQIVLTPNLLTEINEEILAQWTESVQHQEHTSNACEVRYLNSNNDIMPKGFLPSKNDTSYTKIYSQAFQRKQTTSGPTLEEFANINRLQAILVLEQMKKAAPESKWTDKLASELSED